MPACYAHYRFGARSIDQLPSSIQKIVNEYRDLYNIGIHGPDIFFFYKPFKKTNVSNIGYQMHKECASEFFKKARHIYAEHTDNKEAMLAYLLGFLNHYCLDNIDHPYIAKKMVVSGVSHYLVESEYERHLLKLDNSNSCTSHLNPNKFNAMIIHRFFKDITEHDVYESIKGTKVYNKLLLSFNPMKAKVFSYFMDKINIEDFKDHLIISKECEKCLDSNLRLDKLEAKASLLYKELSSNLLAYLNGQGELDKRFEETFDETENIDDILVLDIKGEKEYEI